MKKVLILLILSACTNYEYIPAEVDAEVVMEPLTSGTYRVSNSRISGVSGTPPYARTPSAIRSTDYMRCLMKAFPSVDWLCYPTEHECECTSGSACPRDSGSPLAPAVFSGAGGVWELTTVYGQANTSISRVRLTQNNATPPVLDYQAQWYVPETNQWRQQWSKCRINSDGTATLTVNPSGRISGPTF